MLMARDEREVLEPRHKVVPEEGLLTYTTRYFGQDVGDVFAGATMVDQQPRTKGGAHFHSADQFQVVVEGSGLYGKTHVKRYSVHFAAAFSPYGPISTGEENLRWFTLRNGRDPGGIKWMPASREQLRASGRKPRVVYGDPEIAMQPDGLATWHVRLDPGERYVATSPATGRGQYWLVFDGSGTMGGSDFPRKDGLLFVNADEPPIAIEAGPAGMEVLGVQFPR